MFLYSLSSNLDPVANLVTVNHAALLIVHGMNSVKMKQCCSVVLIDAFSFSRSVLTRFLRFLGSTIPLFYLIVGK